MKNLSNAIGRVLQVEELAGGDSVIHRLAPLAKLILTLCFILTVVSFDRYDVGGLLLFALYPLIIIILADLPPGVIGGALLASLPFTAFTALTGLLFNTRPYGTLGPLLLTYGMISGASLLIKCALTVAAVTAMMATTKLPDLCLALRACGIPNLCVLQFLLCFRYISLLLEEAKRMTLAYRLRNPKHAGIRFVHAGALLGQLLLRSYVRADRVYTAMQCRGFQRTLLLPRPLALSRADWLCAGIGCALMIAARFVNLPRWIEQLLRGSILG